MTTIIFIIILVAVIPVAFVVGFKLGSVYGASVYRAIEKYPDATPEEINALYVPEIMREISTESRR